MLQLHFPPIPRLETARLVLREMRDSDAQALFELRSDPEVMRYIPRPLAQTLDDITAFLTRIDALASEQAAIVWALAEKTDENLLIGYIGYVKIHKEHFRAEVGYSLAPRKQGQGIMHEALQAVIDFGFNTMQLHSIEGIIDPAHQASARVLERHGFVKEGHFKENEFWLGRFWDTVYYSLLKNPM
ncbi:GNAT family N-acetyltransferase [Chitinophaga lutea]